MKVDISLIQPSPYQPRLLFDLSELKDEIKRDGLLNELVVRKQGEAYELIDGERRLRALKRLGWKTVPVRVVKLKEAVVRRSVYKLNKVRENYTVEEEAKYFQKLTAEGMTPQEISEELSVDFHWVLAHLNIFKFPEKIQKALWMGKISISHLVALEGPIGRNIKEAQTMINEIINRKLTLKETKRIILKQKEKLEEMRVDAARKVLGKVAPKSVELRTPNDYEEAAKVLKKIAKKKLEKTLTPKEKTTREAEKKRKLEEKKRKEQEKRRLEKQKIKAEAKKMFRRFQETERSRIQEEAKKEMKTGVAKIQREMRGLTRQIKKLKEEKADFLKKKAFLSDALNFNCPHCQNPCVVFKDGNRYLVKRSASVAIVPEKPATPSALTSLQSPKQTN